MKKPETGVSPIILVSEVEGSGKPKGSGLFQRMTGSNECLVESFNHSLCWRMGIMNIEQGILNGEGRCSRGPGFESKGQNAFFIIPE